MPDISEAQLKKALDQNEIARLYFLHGAEKHLLKRAANRLMKKAHAEQFTEFNFNEFKDIAEVDSISDAVEALPLMAERKCVAVSDYNIETKNQREIDKLYELISNLPESTVLIFYYPTLELDVKYSAKWKKFLKAVQKEGVSAEFGYKTTSDLSRLMIHQAEKRGCSLSRQNAAKLIEYAGNDLKTLLSEMEKLCAFADGNEITFEIIDKLVTKNMETTVFMLSAALVLGEYEKAHRLMDLLFYQREEPVAVLAVLSSSYVDMYRVRAALESGKSFKAPAEYGEYRGKEFRLSKAEKSLKRLSSKALKKSIEVLLETDKALKSSKTDARILMDAMIAKLLLAVREVNVV
jgi:DNA polymerase III, delta subunit